ncbi:penicillin-binding transpeptidase domain-containing protein [Plantactinospora sp. KBS50]|uniref:penicillin-binding transpeptidase domain-containing protein n=1 Tax=Plantactinospora sp. KBS50 TaxID=2024580 RepID=UPI000BAA9937|nr:penicillin-binding transpeptidase domain-containing protein [Plantactinospora sp. KBS50]ASW56406.1 penicillin-binding protein [Plantactinospora sp. KBS50]
MRAAYLVRAESPLRRGRLRAKPAGAGHRVRPARRPPAWVRPTRRLPAALAGLSLLAAGLSGCSSPGPESALDAFLAGWRDGTLDKLAFIDPSGRKLPATDVADELKHLTGDLAGAVPGLRVDGKVTGNGGLATATVAVDWPLPGDGHWTYPTTVRLKQGQDDAWQIIWEPKLVQNDLTSGDQLSVTRLPAKRGDVLDAAGKPLVTSRPVVLVGVDPGQVTDAKDLTRKLDEAFRAIRPPLTPPIDLGDLPERIAAGTPGSRVEVVTLRKDAYDQIRSRIRPLPGTVFLTAERELSPSREFGRAVLGTVDDVQKQDIDADPATYGYGDRVGHGGIAGAYDKQLRGVPGASVQIMRQDPEGALKPISEVFRREPQPGAALRTRLDTGTQTAADAAVATQPGHRTALVALRISDGSILAAANGPGAAEENLAFTAQVPPGSTFKMVTALGLLDAGAVQAETPVDCPKTFLVEGRTFKNSDFFELGTVPFRTDFAKSCNTAFAALAPKLGADGLAAAGRTLGLEGSWQVGLDAFTGKVSTGGPGVERAAAAIGQGTTLVSPLAMACATAAVARGQWSQPTLVAPDTPDVPAAAGPGPQLKAGSVEPLRAMMREVVTAGTATSLAKVPGDPVYGKTGTAEYDNDPAHAHAWFVGWQGDIAFAVFVEQGGSSTASAVPIAEKFLRALPARR